MQDGRNAVWSIPYVSVAAFFPSLKHNFIGYRSSKVSSRPDCIFEIHQLWQLGFSRVYSNSNVPAVRVFANGPGDLGSIPGRVIPKTLKMELDTTLLNTQHYKVRFKGKVEQSWEWSSALPYTLV